MSEKLPKTPDTLRLVRGPLIFAAGLLAVHAGLDYAYQTLFHQPLHWSRVFLVILAILFLFESNWRQSGEKGLWNGITTRRGRLALISGLVIMGVFVGLPEAMPGHPFWLELLLEVIGVGIFVLILYKAGGEDIRRLLFQRPERGQ